MGRLGIHVVGTLVGMAVKDAAKEFEKLIRTMVHKNPLWRVFSDFCELGALAFSNVVIKDPEREARYLKLINSYDKEDRDKFPHLLAWATEGVDLDTDFLGRMFMTLELSNHWRGQFFTPMEIARTLSELTLSDAKNVVKERGFITVSDPACGAGALIIGAAAVLYSQDINPQQCMHVTAVDIDSTAAHMCFIQLSMLGIPAHVVIGDVLRMEERAVLTTPAHFTGGWDRKLKRGYALGSKADPDHVPPPDKELSMKWLDIQTADAKERIFTVMRALRDEAAKLEEEHRRLTPPAGQIAVGGSHMDPFFKANATQEFLGALGRGDDPAKAAARATEESKAAITKWNTSRGKDIHTHRWDGAMDARLQDHVRAIMKAVAPPAAKKDKHVETAVPPTKRLTARQRELLRDFVVTDNVARFRREDHIPDWAHVKEVFTALGAKWVTGKPGGFKFLPSDDGKEKMRLALETGEIYDPKAAGFFPTPDGLAERLVKLADLQPGELVLEPSAGRGAIARAVKRVCPRAHVMCVELMPDNRAELERQGFKLVGDDFMTLDKELIPTPDAVIMNPPFSGQDDIRHIRRAWEFLESGGRLVSAASGSVGTREDRTTLDFQEWVLKKGGIIQQLPDGTFKESGTMVRTCTVHIPRK